MAKIKIGVFGAGRGMVMIDTLMEYPDAELVAICDKYKPLLEKCGEKAKEHNLKIELCEDFEDFFQCDMDAVVLANYAVEHAPYAIRLMKSGRHVLSECLPVRTMSEAVQLVETVEETGKVYNFAENVCFFRNTFEMYKRYRRGDVGEITYAEGEYSHPFPYGDFKEVAGITYGDRNHWRYHIYSTYYCTHSLGPILYITGLRPKKIVGMEVPNTQFLYDRGYTKGTAGITLIELENGAIVKNLVGGLRKLPITLNFQLYGTEGCMETDRWKENYLNVFTDREIDGISGHQHYECPVLSDDPLAKKITTHGGADFYATHYFIQNLLGDDEAKKLSMDVYQALDMATPGILGYRSILEGSSAIEIPDFRLKEYRDLYRHDVACTDKNIAGDMVWPVNSRENIHIPDEVYKKIENVWKESQK